VPTKAGLQYFVLVSFSLQRVLVIFELLDLIVQTLHVAEKRKVFFLSLRVHSQHIVVVVHAHLQLQFLESRIEILQLIVDRSDRFLVVL
jgi:hypothetical protein